MDTTDPQTDREWMIKLSGQMDNLAQSINNLGDKLIDIEKTQIAKLAERMNAIEAWKLQISGAWKLAVILWVIGTAIGIGAIWKFFQGNGR